MTWSALSIVISALPAQAPCPGPYQLVVHIPQLGGPPTDCAIALDVGSAAPGGPPVVTTVSGDSGLSFVFAEGKVVIAGANFGAVQGQSWAACSDVNLPLRIDSWSDTQIVCYAPSAGLLQPNISPQTPLTTDRTFEVHIGSQVASSPTMTTIVVPPPYIAPDDAQHRSMINPQAPTAALKPGDRFQLGNPPDEHPPELAEHLGTGATRNKLYLFAQQVAVPPTPTLDPAGLTSAAQANLVSGFASVLSSHPHVEAATDEWHDDYATGTLPGQSDFDAGGFAQAAYAVATRDGVASKPYQVALAVQPPSAAPLPVAVIRLTLTNWHNGTWYDISNDASTEVTLGCGVGRFLVGQLPKDGPTEVDAGPVFQMLYRSLQFNPDQGTDLGFPVAANTDPEKVMAPDLVGSPEQLFSPLVVMPVRGDAWMAIAATAFDETDVDSSGAEILVGRDFGMAGQASRTLSIDGHGSTWDPAAHFDYTFTLSVDMQVLGVIDGAALLTGSSVTDVLSAGGLTAGTHGLDASAITHAVSVPLSLDMLQLGLSLTDAKALFGL